jgi:hypothetical protein
MRLGPIRLRVDSAASQRDVHDRWLLERVLWQNALGRSSRLRPRASDPLRCYAMKFC